MKSYEKALEALKAKYEAREKAPASARNELKTVIKRRKAFAEERPVRNIWRA